MTAETQTFISLEDIVAIRFKCSCGLVMSVPMSAEVGTGLLDLEGCRNCSKKWFQGDKDQRFIALRELMKYVDAVRESTASWDGVLIDLQLAALPSSREAV